jgi:hypothetical protein
LAPAPALVEFAPSFAQRPVVVPASLTNSDACGPTAYVTGDMVGDASPAAVFASLCPGR